MLVKNSDCKTEVGLVRLGPDKGRVSLQYQTVKMSATPGKHYRSVSHIASIPTLVSMFDEMSSTYPPPQQIPPTEVVFEDGEYYKRIPLDILYAPTFDGTLEFALQVRRGCRGTLEFTFPCDHPPMRHMATPHHPPRTPS